MAETRQERQQRFSQRDMERQAKEDAIKRGLGSFGPQAPWLAGLMAPSSGITDYFGLYPEAPTGQGITGETLPSFGENIQNKQYLDALYQGLGLAGDAMYASTPFTGAVGILGGTALKGMGAVGKATKASKPIKAYHGSPHDFEKFDIGRMGSGEGFQAFGRGIYFAEAEDVAKVYRDALSRRQVFYDGKPVKFKLGSVRELENPTGDSEIDTALMMMQEHRMTPEEYIKYTEDEAIEIPSMKDFFQQRSEKIRKVKDKITLKSTGKIYETDLHVTPDELLDWDEPLSKQPKAVQKKLDSLPKMSDEYDVGKSTDYRWHFYTKKDDLLDTELPSFKTEEQAMRFLNDPDADDYYKWLTAGQYKPIERARIGELDKAGIKGIKYSDAFSRGTETGTSNYVIFDTRILDIANKYGVAIPVAGAMLLSIDKGEKAIEGGRKDI